eukprot:m.31362 g.31362  ORF g.31362 m.31362 type:complete len:60 (+) comp9414_c0_seq2:2534-2713(+)
MTLGVKVSQHFVACHSVTVAGFQSRHIETREGNTKDFSLAVENSVHAALSSSEHRGQPS